MKLLDQLRASMAGDYSPATIETYARWVVRYIGFCDRRHPAEFGPDQVKRYLAWLATEKQVSPRTQNQALHALTCLYRFLGRDYDLSELRAKTGRHLPETASPTEIEQVLSRLPHKYFVMACLVYGAGLSTGECVTLKIYNLDFAGQVIILDGRQAPMPQRVRPDLHQLAIVARHWPGNVDEYLFLSGRRHRGRCWHVSPSSLQKAIKRAVGECGLVRRITPKTLRHSFVRSLLMDGYDVRTVQDVAGYRDVKSVLVHEDSIRLSRVTSPVDNL